MCMESLMSHRLNIVLSDATWAALQTVPKGERSRIIDSALAREFERQRRQGAIARMDALRETMSPVAGSSEEWIREDREDH